MIERAFDHRLAWLAGIIDGEGWIGFHAVSGVEKRGHYVNAQWNIGISNTDAAMLNEIAAIGDALAVKYAWYPIKVRDKRPRHKPFGRILFFGRPGCEVVLRAVFPYLVTKRAQAELMLRAIEHRGTRRYGGGAYIPLPKDDAFREMELQIRSMNRRGVRPQGD